MMILFWARRKSIAGWTATLLKSCGLIQGRIRLSHGSFDLNLRTGNAPQETGWVTISYNTTLTEFYFLHIP